MIIRQSGSNLIFVVGVWRSGTSLLHAMLNNHPQIALLYEAELFGLYPPAANRTLPKDWQSRMECFNQVLSRHQLDSLALPQKTTGREVMLTLAHSWAARKKASVMGDKSVACHTKLPALARIFPEADFIILWRDPLDSCRSAVNAGKQNSFFGRKGVLTQTFFGAAQLAEGVLKLRANGRRVHEVVYEELVNDPVNELTQICRFVGLEFDPQMLALAAADHSMLPAGEHHRAVRSGAVQKRGERAEVLPAGFIAKGHRYAAYWRKRYADLAFIRTLPATADEPLPNAWEKFGDQKKYFCWRCWNNFKHRIICRMPLFLWQRWRREKQAAMNNASTAPAEKMA